MLTGCAMLRAQVPAVPIALRPCTPEKLGEEVRCATITVAEDRALADGRTIELNIMVLPARAAQHAPDALFVLAGGPGQAATDNIDFYAEIFDSVRAERDVVLLDQRGTSGTHRLGCDLFADDPGSLLGERFSAEAAERCVRTWQDSVALRCYTSLDAVEDLEAVRRSLGYEHIDLFGTSYGTRVALLYLKAHPERVRCAILKGTVNFDLSPHNDVQRALDLLFADCAQDSACRKAFPDLRERFLAWMVKVEAGGVPAMDSIPLTSAFVWSTIRSVLQNTGASARLPRLLDEACEGDAGALVDMGVRLRKGLSAAVSGGVAFSVFCSEDVALHPDAAIGPDPLAGACRNWPVRALPADFTELPMSDIPVLFVSGALDPATPPRMAEEVMRSFMNARHLIVPKGSHSYAGLSPCLDGIMAAFIANAAPSKLDVRCTEGIVRPAFIVTRD